MRSKINPQCITHYQIYWKLCSEFSEIDSRHGKTVLFSTTCRLDLGPIEPPIQLVLSATSRRKAAGE
jgi:hypothetical protein